MANSYLQRTTGTPASQTKFTVSAWVKRSGLHSSNNMDMLCIYSDSSNRIHLRFQGDDIDVINYGGSTQARLTTDRKFRDTSAWYHIVWRVDTTLATADDRVRLYVNGVQETSFSTRTNPSQNFNFGTNWSTTRIGLDNSSSYFDGYISHIAYADGQSLAPTVFGETDSTSGIWKFKGPSGVTWGTNGFHLKFENSANLGLDSSGNSNSFATVGNLKQALDTPSNVFATLNPLATFANITLTNGNNTYTLNAGTWESTPSTLALPSSGKYYAEFKWNASSTSAQYMMVGVDSPQLFSSWSTQYPGYTSVGYAYGWDGDKRNNASSSSYGAAWGATSIIGVAIDMDNKKLYFHKDGVYQNSGVPTSGSTGTGALSLTGDEYYIIVSGYKNSENPSIYANFGNGYFGTTAVSSAGTNASNLGIFEYDVPSGYTALCTKGLNL